MYFFVCFNFVCLRYPRVQVAREVTEASDSPLNQLELQVVGNLPTWKMNFNSLQELYVLLTTKPSF